MRGAVLFPSGRAGLAARAPCPSQGEPPPAPHGDPADDAEKGQGLGEGQGEPDARHAQQARQQHEAGYEQQRTAQQGKKGGGREPLEALEVSDDGQVQDEADAARSEEREARRGDLRGPVGRVEEEAHEQPRRRREAERHERPAPEGRQQGDAAGGNNARPLHAAEVVADDRLRRLGDGVADHEDEGHVVAGDPEGPDPRIAEVVHEDPVSGEHQHGHRRLAQQGRRADPALVADVAPHQTEALAAPLERVEAQRPGTAEQVAEDDRPAQHDADRRGEGGPHDAPAEREDEQVVEHDIRGGREQAAPHGQPRCAVEADDIEPDGDPELGNQPRHEPDEVVDHLRQQVPRRAQQQGDLPREGEDQRHGQRREERDEEHRLRDVDPCGLVLAPCEVDRGDHRAAGARHQPRPREEHQQRDAEVHRGDAVAAHAVSHENAVDDRHRRHAEHPQQGGDEESPEEVAHAEPPQINRVPFHLA